MRIRGKIFLFALTVTSISAVQAAEDFQIKAWVDRSVIGINEQFILNVELSGNEAGRASTPQLPDMNEFAAFLGSGSSQNFQIINGVTSISKTINYYFQATKIGKFTIGPIKIKVKNKTYQTDPIPIEITKSSSKPRQSAQSQRNVQQGQSDISNEDIFIKTVVNKKKVYQNEPVIVTYKIYTRVNMTPVGFTKLPATTGFWKEEFPMGQQIPTHTEIVDGKRYTVATIKKMALFPMTPGKKVIEPLVLQCRIRVRKRRSMFDDFFNDDFFSDPFGRTIQKNISSEPVIINVIPLPENGKPKDFKGVVGDYKISSFVDKADVKTNEAITYTLTISGTGNIRSLPEPEISFSHDLEAYPPEVSEKIERKGNSISGTRTYEYVLIPRAAGTQKIQPVTFTFFDPSSKTYKTLRTDPITIRVQKGREISTPIPQITSKEEVELVGKEIRFIMTEPPSFRKIGEGIFKSYTLIIIFISPLILLFAAVSIRKHQDRLRGDIAYARNRRAGKFARKRLSMARSLLNVESQKEFYAEVGKALLGYIGDKLNIEEAGIIRDEVKNMLTKKGVSEEVLNRFFKCLDICDMKRFSPTGSTIDEMKKFLKEAEECLVIMDRHLAKQNRDLSS